MYYTVPYTTGQRPLQMHYLHCMFLLQTEKYSFLLLAPILIIFNRLAKVLLYEREWSFNEPVVICFSPSQIWAFSWRTPQKEVVFHKMAGIEEISSKNGWVSRKISYWNMKVTSLLCSEFKDCLTIEVMSQHVASPSSLPVQVPDTFCILNMDWDKREFSQTWHQWVQSWKVCHKEKKQFNVIGWTQICMFISV